MSDTPENQSRIVVKNGIMTITTRTGEVHHISTPHLPDCEQVPNPMVIEHVEIKHKGMPTTGKPQ